LVVEKKFLKKTQILELSGKKLAFLPNFCTICTIENKLLQKNHSKQNYICFSRTAGKTTYR
jgi:hypothetical protein